MQAISFPREWLTFGISLAGTNSICQNMKQYKLLPVSAFVAPEAEVVVIVWNTVKQIFQVRMKPQTTNKFILSRKIPDVKILFIAREH